jgi:hypothetical protein
MAGLPSRWDTSGNDPVQIAHPRQQSIVVKQIHHTWWTSGPVYVAGRCDLE